MKLLIVGGLSGAGKTVALHSLEDLGAYCIDNLPVNLLPDLARHAEEWDSGAYPCVAVGVDARNIGSHDMGSLLRTLRDHGIEYEIIYLEASREVLLKRFSETRRKHPLTNQDRSLTEAIDQDRELLQSLAERADIRIDTTQLHVHQLHEQIRDRINLSDEGKLTLFFQSFGFKHGLPQDADYVFDARCLPNPYWEPRLRNFTGRDPEIREFLQAQPQVLAMQTQILDFLGHWIPRFAADHRRYLTIAFGCTGGRHRSVYLAEQVAAHFRQQYDRVLLRHREFV